MIAKTTMIAAFVSLNFLVAALAQAADMYAISIKQRHSYFGKAQILFTDSALRMDFSAEAGFVLVAKAPSWQIYIFREKEKRVFTESFMSFVRNGLVAHSKLPGKQALLREQRYFVRQTTDGFQTMHLEKNGRFDFLPASTGVSKQIIWIVNAAYRTPYVDGFPLNEIDTVGQLRGRQAYLGTIAIKRSPVLLSNFDLPVDCTTVQNVNDVVFR